VYLEFASSNGFRKDICDRVVCTRPLQEYIGTEFVRMVASLSLHTVFGLW
jgi:hypothetical protein